MSRDSQERGYQKPHGDHFNCPEIYPEFLKYPVLGKPRTRSTSILWEKIKEKKLGFAFYLYVYVYNYQVAFYCYAKKLDIEVNDRGEKFKTSSDEIRDKILRNYGVTTLRLSHEMLTETSLSRTVDHIRSVMDNLATRNDVIDEVLSRNSTISSVREITERSTVRGENEITNFCFMCGGQVKEQDKFCRTCGIRLQPAFL
ncbi:MAG: DUF559 domain-containing protein [Nitrososphaerales archaeon]